MRPYSRPLRTVDRRYPRERVTITTPAGAVEVGCWAVVNDADSYLRVHPRAGIVFRGPDHAYIGAGPFMLGDTGPFSNRRALRIAVTSLVHRMAQWSQQGRWRWSTWPVPSK